MLHAAYLHAAKLGKPCVHATHKKQQRQQQAHMPEIVVGINSGMHPDDSCRQSLVLPTMQPDQRTC